jgi:hypothetical protein
MDTRIVRHLIYKLLFPADNPILRWNILIATSKQYNNFGSILMLLVNTPKDLRSGNSELLRKTWM